jgi:hypothetical protein
MADYTPPGGSGGGISLVTSTGATVAVTNPHGPTTDLEVPVYVVPAIATTVTGPAGFGTAAALGAGTKYAPDTHSHGNPPAPSASPQIFSSFIAVDVPLGATAVDITSLALPAGNWLITAQVLSINAGVSTAWIGPNSADPTGAYSSSGAAFATYDAAAVSFSRTVTLSAPATVYLSMKAGGGSGSALAQTPASAFDTAAPNSTGINAIGG